jgi:hypothetical protein
MIVIVFFLSIIKNCDFELGNLVNTEYTSHHMDVLNFVGNGSLAANQIKKGKYIEVSIHESDRVSIFLFGLSTLYDTDSNDIFGRNNDLILKITKISTTVS